MWPQYALIAVFSYMSSCLCDKKIFFIKGISSYGWMEVFDGD